MTFPNRPVEAVDGWHAHIYYDPARTKETAAKLRARIEQAFPETRMGSWHDEAVGPHLVSMYQLAFRADQFDRVVPWLVLNRDGLSILVHPLTDNAWNDHVVFGFWLGERQPLNDDVLKRIPVRSQRRQRDITQ